MTKKDMIVEKALDILEIRGCTFTVELPSGEVITSEVKQKAVPKVKKVKPPRETVDFEDIKFDIATLNLNEKLATLTQENNRIYFDKPEDCPVEFLKFNINKMCREKFGDWSCFVNYNANRLGVNVHLRPPRPVKD
jgi:hypothetical protein